MLTGKLEENKAAVIGPPIVDKSIYIKQIKNHGTAGIQVSLNFVQTN